MLGAQELRKEHAVLQCMRAPVFCQTALSCLCFGFQQLSPQSSIFSLHLCTCRCDLVFFSILTSWVLFSYLFPVFLPDNFLLWFLFRSFERQFKKFPMFSLFSFHFSLFQDLVSKRGPDRGSSCASVEVTWSPMVMCLCTALITHSPLLFILLHFLLFILWAIFLRKKNVVTWIGLMDSYISFLFC